MAAQKSSKKRPASQISSAGKRAGSRPLKKRKRKKQPEPTPVIGGRFLIAVVIIALAVFIPMSTLGNWFQKPGPGAANTAAWRKGHTAAVRITLVTADYDKLTCTSNKMLDGAHCGYKSTIETWPRDPGAPLDDNKKNVIQPYRTWPDNQLILVTGLWATPGVAMRLHNEPSAGVPEKKLARFVATCQMRFLGQIEGAKLRWTPGGKWLDQGRATVARALSCKVGEEE